MGMRGLWTKVYFVNSYLNKKVQRIILKNIFMVSFCNNRTKTIVAIYKKMEKILNWRLKINADFFPDTDNNITAKQKQWHLNDFFFDFFFVETKFYNGTWKYHQQTLTWWHKNENQTLFSCHSWILWFSFLIFFNIFFCNCLFFSQISSSELIKCRFTLRYGR